MSSPIPVSPVVDHDRAGGGTADRREHSVAGRSVAPFWAVAATLTVFLSASAAPSPLYAVYQARFGFSSLTLTIVFASYAVALLVALLTLGGLSDVLGRRPVLLAALAVEVASMVVFLTAHGTAALIVARVLQGVATGPAIGAASAALVDLQPAGTRLGSELNGPLSMTGLALGSLGAGLLLDHAPAPTVLPFVLLSVAFVLLAGLLWRLVPPAPRRPGLLTSLVPRLRVPSVARAPFARAAPVIVASWAISALYLSLGPSVAAVTFGLHGHLAGAAVTGAFMAAGTVVAVATRRAPAGTVMLVGAGVLTAGTLAATLAVATGSVTGFVLGTVVAGAGFGPAFQGAFRQLAALAPEAERAELLAAVFVVSYLGFSLPAIAAGALEPHLGLRTTVVGYGAVVAALAALVLVAEAARALLARRSAHRPS